MAAFAAFHVISRADVKRLVAAADSSNAEDFGDVVDEVSREQGDFDWSGYTLVFLLEYLYTSGALVKIGFDEAERQLTSAVSTGAYLLTPEAIGDDRRLDPELFSGTEISAYFDELGVGFPESGEAGLEGIGILSGYLNRLEPEDVLLILVS